MTRTVHEIRAGFIPLLDCAPLFAASALGFDRAEGLALRLVRETSWATLRDRIAVGHLQIAHMLAPMPIAANLGLTPLPALLVAPLALGSGGNSIAVSGAVWTELVDADMPDEPDATAAAAAMAAVVQRRRRQGAKPLTLAVVHPFSAHRYQLAYWLASAGVDPTRHVDLVVVPPPLMPAALAGGQIDGFCAGEPWGSVAVRQARARILATNADIWRSSPEKVLGMRRDWAESDPDRLARLIRAVFRAAVWCDQPHNRNELAHLLAGPEALDQPVEVLLPGLERRVQRSGRELDDGGFLTFADRAATFPWASHALWFFSQMVRWGETPMAAEGLAAARSAYRPDLYRTALQPLGVTLPSANAKVEGALTMATPAASPDGRLLLGPDTFCDGRIFDPDRVGEYVAEFSIRVR